MYNNNRVVSSPNNGGNNILHTTTSWEQLVKQRVGAFSATTLGIVWQTSEDKAPNATAEFDAKIVCGEKEFGIQKSIACAASPVFKAAFTNEMKEKAENRYEVTDSQIDPETVELMISFIYGQLRGNEPQWTKLDGVEKLLNASEEFMINPLKVLCFLKLVKMMSVTNAADICYLLHKFKAEPEYKSTIHTYIADNLGDVIITGSFDKKTEEYPEAFIPILKLVGDRRRRNNSPNQNWCNRCGHMHTDDLMGQISNGLSSIQPPSFNTTRLG